MVTAVEEVVHILSQSSFPNFLGLYTLGVLSHPGLGMTADTCSHTLSFMQLVLCDIPAPTRV